MSFKDKVLRPVKLDLLQDLFLFAGLGLLGYGLYLFKPWLSFTICGVLLMLIGYLMEVKD